MIKGVEVDYACEAAGSKLYRIQTRQSFETANRDAVIQRLIDKYGQPADRVKQPRSSFDLLVWGARYPKSALRKSGGEELDGLVAIVSQTGVTLTLNDLALRKLGDQCEADAKAAESKADLAKVQF